MTPLENLELRLAATEKTVEALSHTLTHALQQLAKLAKIYKAHKADYLAVVRELGTTVYATRRDLEETTKTLNDMASDLYNVDLEETPEPDKGDGEGRLN